MVDNARMIGEALKEIPCIGDGDTGYGNAVNVKRTVKGYAQVRLIGYAQVCMSPTAWTVCLIQLYGCSFARHVGNPDHTSRCHFMPIVLLGRPGFKAS